MKTSIAFLAAGVAALSLLHGETQVQAEALSPTPATQVEVQPILILDSTSVFEAAFWRRLHPDDTLLHAERREWRDEHGTLRQWQWFIAFEPAPSTLAWLASNPFLLPDPVAGETARLPSEAPAWFPAEWNGYTVQQSANGQHSIALSPHQVCFATDSGGGFQDLRSDSRE